MGNDTRQSGFQRGVLALVILGSLRRGDMHGYQLVQYINSCSSGGLSTQEGSMYPVLYRLLDQGYISDRKELVGKRRTRVIYHLEPAGAIHLQELTEEYEQVTSSVFRIIREEDKFNEP